MKKTTRIGIDFDGVLADHRQHKIRIAESDFGITLEPWQTNSNVVREFFTPEQYKEFKDSLYGALTREVLPFEGALETLSELRADLYVVSARLQPTIRFVQDWMSKHRLYDVIPADRIVFCGSDVEKGEYCEKFRLDVFLDDKVRVLELLPDVERKMLFDPDGIADKVGAGEGIVAVKSWVEFADAVRELRAWA